jgi:hypothetical protein
MIASQQKALTNTTYLRQRKPGRYSHKDSTDGSYQAMEEQMDGIKY